MDFDKFARIEVGCADDVWAWLHLNHTQTQSVWLVTYKAADPLKYVSRDMVLDALIAYGWIDGRRVKLDDLRTMQLISPRKQNAWAQSYKARAARLTQAGRMHPAGLAAIKAGQDSGLWSASEPIDALVDPDDLLAAMRHAGALIWWHAEAPSYRRNILRWIAAAKQPQTRAKRIKVSTDHAAQGRKVPQY